MTIKAILFDIDGTLVDSNDAHIAAWDTAFRREGIAIDRDTIHDQIGKGSDMLLPTLVPDASEDARDRMSEAHGTVFAEEHLDQVRPFADAHALLARAKSEGRQVVLASSAKQTELDHYLDLLDARDIVGATTSGDDVAHTKPAPDIFATALAKIAPIAADEAIVVGDTPYDIAAAKRCGLRAVAVRSGGFADATLQEAGAVALYDDVAALLADWEASPLAA